MFYCIIPAVGYYECTFLCSLLTTYLNANIMIKRVSAVAKLLGLLISNYL